MSAAMNVGTRQRRRHISDVARRGRRLGRHRLAGLQRHRRRFTRPGGRVRASRGRARLRAVRSRAGPAPPAATCGSGRSIIADIENPSSPPWCGAIEDVAHANGYRLVLCNSDEDLAKEAGYVDIAIAERMAGVVIAVASDRAPAWNRCSTRQIPVVTIDRPRTARDWSTRSWSTTATGWQRHRHLINAGAQRVGCITGPARATRRRASARVPRRIRKAGRCQPLAVRPARRLPARGRLRRRTRPARSGDGPTPCSSPTT